MGANPHGYRLHSLSEHRAAEIERVPLDPHSGQVIQAVAGVPFDERLIGPSDFAWGRGPEANGSVAYVTTDGGFTAPPPDGVVRPAKVLRMEKPFSLAHSSIKPPCMEC